MGSRLQGQSPQPVEPSLDTSKMSNHDLLCEDCNETMATCTFLHLDGRQFALCDACFRWADHEAEYLRFCDCRIPQGEDGSCCLECRLQIRSWGPEPEEDEEPYVEEQYDDFLAEESEPREEDEQEQWPEDY